MPGYTLTLQESREVADGTRLFVFDKPEGYDYQAGQYVAMTLPKLVAEDQKGASRSLSIASAPYEDHLYFTMRGGESGFKQTLWQMNPGDTVTVTKAVGFFTTHGDERENGQEPIVFLVGGIGITPVRSILKQAEHDQSGRSFTLFYSNRFQKDAAFHEELKGLKLENFRYVTVLSQSEEPCEETDEERGYICNPMLHKYVDGPEKSLYYLVGSPQFIEAMEDMLEGMGVPKERRKKDPFTGLRVLPNR